MDDKDRIRTESDILFGSLDRLYGHRFEAEMQEKLRGAIETVARTVVALRSVSLDRYGEPSLPFTPFRKED